jgi:hypothetical protein
LKLIRQEAGRDVFILGCCTPQNMRSYGGAFGLVDAMRIGPDNGARWKDLLTGPTYGSRQYFLHGRVWYNDPDPIYVRASVPLEQAQLICSWVAISGQMNLSSEWFPSLPSDRLDLLKRTMPNHGLLPRPVDLFDSAIPRLWLLSDTRRTPRRDVLALYNWEDTPASIAVSQEKLGLDPRVGYVAFDYWSNAVLSLSPGEFQIPVPARSCRILSLRPVADHPQLISTSRHITQGIVDVQDEKWSSWRRTLRGTSKIVANDPYELRVLVPAQRAGSAVQARVSDGDREAGVRVRSGATQDGLLRVTLESPVSREVQWSIEFGGGDRKSEGGGRQSSGDGDGTRI